MSCAFGHLPAGAEENNAIALSEDGTVTVLAGFSKPPKNPAPNTPLGLWAALRRPGGRWSTPQKLSRAGDAPLVLWHEDTGRGGQGIVVATRSAAPRFPSNS